MKEKFSTNKTNIIISIIGIVVIIFCMLKITGVFDIVDAIFPDRYISPIDTYATSEIIDEWKSEPYGKLGAYVKVESKDNGYVYVTNICDKGTGFNDHSNYPTNDPSYSIETISKYERQEIVDHGTDEDRGETYTYFFAPLDCQYMMANDTRLDPQEGSVKTKDGTATFKIFTITTPTDDDFEYSRLDMVDEKGEAHPVQH